jgi:acyl-CoA reductase-like NAD-dependent aldehyde dehydrogenase
VAVTKEAPSPAPAGTKIEVENPATGQIIAEVPAMSAEQVREMCARARAAQPGWEAMGFEGRGRVFRRAQKWLLDNSDRVIETIVSETGKTWEDAQMAEIGYCAAAFGFWADMAPEYLKEERLRSRSLFVKGKKLVVRYAPVGVVGVIGPWNYPLSNSFGDCVPALMAGNSVVLKPSEITPLSSLLMEEMLNECGIPENVYNVATGYGDTGAALIDEVDFVMFTGSTGTGKKVMAKAAETLTPVSLELGGKDPMIVCADADLERAANGAVYYSIQNAGQTCISTERVYVEEPIYDQFVNKVVDKVRELRTGQSTGRGTAEVGAIIHPPQSDIIEAHVKDAIDKGARVLVGGGRRDENGHFFEPTVLVDVDHTMDCMREETFGPTLPIMKVGSAEEALRLANDTPYGLQASVYTKDVEKGERLARQIEAGAVTVNDAQLNYIALELPMGGWKTSGLGTRHGSGGIRKYTKSQTVLVAKLAPKRGPHMFPYTAKRSERLLKLLRFVYGRGKRE